MASSLAGFGIPFILDAPKSREEKIEEARRSGYIRSNNPKDINTNREQLCCKRCGSLNIVVGSPIIADEEKGGELPYMCNDCGYTGTRVIRVKNVIPSKDDPNKVKLVADLVPEGLVGITGSLAGTDY
jgi:hypothetical protein